MSIHSLGHSLILCAALLAVNLAAAQEPTVTKKMRKYAVLVGINEYTGAFGKLQYCHNDMGALRDRLVASGFPEENVAYLRDGQEDEKLLPTKANIDSQLKVRMSIASPGDLVLVAFSGHGVHLNGKSYYCPIDSKLNEPAQTMVAIEDVYQVMEASKALQKLLIVDACRNDPARSVKSPNAAGVRGVGAGEFQATKPPSGIRVLQSCAPGQFSMEDPTLKHGVFLHYITQGLDGSADTEVEGNKNGMISLEELYHYAHERTKIHVANRYTLDQTPYMKGEISGRFEIAAAPGSGKPDVKVPVETKPKPPEPKPMVPEPQPAPTQLGKSQPRGDVQPSHPLLDQGNIYIRRADYDNAIHTFSAVIENSDLASAIRTEARLSRGGAYLSKGGKDNLHKALIDYKSAGKDTIPLTVKKASEDLMITTTKVGVVKQGEVVDISTIDGNWLWVASVNGIKSRQGYITWDAIIPPPPPPAPAPAPVQQQQFNSFDFDDD